MIDFYDILDTFEEVKQVFYFSETSMTTDLKKFEQARKTNIADTIGSWLRLGVEELGRVVSGSKKHESSTHTWPKNQITPELDKYENAKIGKHKKQS